METNTKAIQQLRLDKKGCETKLENEKKIVKLWQQKHAVKEREATTHLEQKSKAQAEKSKLQAEKTKVEAEKAKLQAEATALKKQKSDLFERLKQTMEKVKTIEADKASAAATKAAAPGAFCTFPFSIPAAC